MSCREVFIVHLRSVNTGIFWVPKICGRKSQTDVIWAPRGTRFTPRKINGWNLPITHEKKGQWSEPGSIIFRFRFVNLQGCFFRPALSSQTIPKLDFWPRHILHNYRCSCTPCFPGRSTGAVEGKKYPIKKDNPNMIGSIWTPKTMEKWRVFKTL